MKLAVISHTIHHYNNEGKLVGWGPTIRELNYLATKFDSIIHLACLENGIPPESSAPYEASNIEFIPIPVSGGKTFSQKLGVLKHARDVIGKVNTILPLVDLIQIRVPTGMANYLLPYLYTKSNKPPIWVKYAGNWKQEHAPLGYQFQRWWLKKNFLKCKVTINGKWNDQPKHCYTFENPCLNIDEREVGKNIILTKNYSGALIACFIGRIEKEKGVGRILDSLQALADKNITIIHFIGDGESLSEFEKIAHSQTAVRCIFHGSLQRTAIPVILEQSHLLLLPSTASEGFPKVIAEGANYGAIPVVSDVSSIGQYINDSNGYVWPRKDNFTQWIGQIDLNNTQLQQRSKSAYAFAEEFTFEHYFHNITTFIINDNKVTK